MTTTRVLTSTQVMRDRDGGRVPAGRYIWRGAAGQPVFRLADSREIVTQDVDVICETVTSAVFEIVRTRVGAAVHPSTMHQFRNVRVYGNGKATHGFLVHSTTADQNGEHMRFDCVSVYGCLTGWKFVGQNAKEALLTNCRFESGITAVSADSGFQWIGGTAAVCETGVFLTRYGDPVVIQGVGFEACGRMLLTVNASTDSQPVTLIGCRFAADQLHEDGAMILMRHAGPLTILGGSYGDGQQRTPQIHLAGIGEQSVTVIGAKFGAFGAHEVPVVRSNPGVRPALFTQGAMYQTGINDPERTTTRNATELTT